MSLTQTSSAYPATQDKARQLAVEAAASDPQWQPIADDMTTLVALGTDTSSAAVTKGQATFTDLSNQCRSVGVVVNGG
ncbi:MULTISPECIES: hypothetical protein [Subtercola]|uniref:hypothetical protein n=1 Tax=Subtercola TaxID=120212 RepID=UPI0010AAB464|nr:MULTISPECIES: hypothetical protein [Subtercola]MEA9984793.1 hypothetical protein [Subtercola sp. RTI3]